MQVVSLSDGRKLAYDALITTLPLDITCRWLGKPEWADGLQHSSSHIVGIGEGRRAGVGGWVGVEGGQGWGEGRAWSRAGVCAGQGRRHP